VDTFNTSRIVICNPPEETLIAKEKRKKFLKLKEEALQHENKA